MMPQTSSPQIFKVRRPDGKVWDIPEHNLDKAIELGGEVVEGMQAESSVSEPTAAPPTPDRVFKVKRPDGQIWDIPERNLAKAQQLGGQVIEDSPQEGTANLPSPDANLGNNGEYGGENPGAAWVKNAVAGLGGLVPDIPIDLHNLTNQREMYDPYTGETFSQTAEEQAANKWERVTDKISKAIDNATGGYTKDTGPINKYSAQFLGSLFPWGWAGKGLQALGAAEKVGKASGAAEKVGAFITDKIGIAPNAKGAAAAAAAGATVGFSEDNDLPVALEIPAVIGAFILGGKFGGAVSSTAKNQGAKLLKPLFEEYPGLEKFLQKQNYQDLAKKINPESIQDLMKTSLIEKETGFLKEKTLSELPQEIRLKLEENPALLNDEEIKTVIDKGLKDFNDQVTNLQKEYFPLTLGEETASPKILAKEDQLANKPNIENFDIAQKQRKLKIAQRLEKVQHDLSSKGANSEELGEKIAKTVGGVYDDAIKLRRENFLNKFGAIVDEPILPIDGYKSELQELTKLIPDNKGNEVAINAAKKRLKNLPEDGKISPRRANDILAGLNEEIKRFPDKTFSKAQMLKIKNKLESDITGISENSLDSITKEQATLLKDARRGYAEDSKIIDKIDESILFNKIGEGNLSVPEKIAQSFNNMPSSQLRLTFDALRRSPNHQEIIPQIQRYYIEEAVKAATKGGADTFNPRIFLDKLPKKAEFDVIFENTKAYQEIKDMSVLLKRVAKFQPARSNSKTEQRRQADRGDLEEGLETISKIAKGDAPGLLNKAFGKLRKFLPEGQSRDENIASLLLSPEKRAEILKMVNHNN